MRESRSAEPQSASAVVPALALGIGANIAIFSVVRGAPLLVGLGIGVASALFAMQLFRGSPFGVAPHDPVTLVFVAGLMGVIGLAACGCPRCGLRESIQRWRSDGNNRPSGPQPCRVERCPGAARTRLCRHS
jgi:hypothetical protein